MNTYVKTLQATRRSMVTRDKEGPSITIRLYGSRDVPFSNRGSRK